MTARLVGGEARLEAPFAGPTTLGLLDLVWSELTLEDGTLGEFRVHGDSRPVCRVPGSDLLVAQREIQLQPGLNVLEVRRTAALELSIPRGLDLQSASVRPSSNGAHAVEPTTRRRTDETDDGGGTVRWDALPLGVYAWRVGDGAWSSVTLSRPGSVVHLQAR